MKDLFLCMLLLTISIADSAQTTFKTRQLAFDRVKSAYMAKWGTIRNELKAQGISNNFNLFLAAYKQEGKLEVWIKSGDKKSYQLFKIYAFSGHSGVIGPKVKEGDLQTPEGFYHITAYNPESKFHLSLGINYPNNTDLLRSGREKPGSEIYIHGDCVTAGCIPITDDKIRELYILAVEAREHGQREIPVHIYPFKMTAENMKIQSEKHPHQKAFWTSLKSQHDAFEKSRMLP